MVEQEKKGRHFVRTTYEITFLSLPFLGELRLRVKRHKIVEGSSPSDKTLRRWREWRVIRLPPEPKDKN